MSCLVRRLRRGQISSSEELRCQLSVDSHKGWYLLKSPNQIMKFVGEGFQIALSELRKWLNLMRKSL